MNNSLLNKISKSLKDMSKSNSNLITPPEVILWPDPEKQWESIIPILRMEFPELLTLGEFLPDKKQGPAIWIKCMVAKVLPQADWSNDTIPIIYMPGISKGDFKNISSAGMDLQPLMEYQYTGTIFTQINGKEWTVLAFFENEQLGLGLKVAQDKLTRETLVKVLPTIFQDHTIKYPAIIDVDFLNSLLFPDVYPSVLNWMCKGDEFIKSLPLNKQDVFINLCRSRFEFDPDYKNIIAIVQMFGMQNNAWRHVWQLFASSPKKYPELEELLRLAKPEDMGYALFEVKKESWPQINETLENELRALLLNITNLHPKEILIKLNELEENHSERRGWVWAEFGYSSLAQTLPHLLLMTKLSTKAFPFTTIDDLTHYYVTDGCKIDQEMRKSLLCVKTEQDKDVIIKLINVIYKPWLETITNKFQTLVTTNPSLFIVKDILAESDEYILFVDAFRYELAQEFMERLNKQKYKIELNNVWSALPSLTPTAKPNVSPIVKDINPNSNCNEFRPQLNNGRDLQITQFRELLEENNYRVVTNISTIETGRNYWQEIGDIDTRGHEEQSDIIKRINELFDKIQEVLETVFNKGINRIKIVTDHGWLLLPGGLPKEDLNKNLTETRWGRCALIKEGAETNLLQLPWRWNPNIFIAYATGISFFKKNEEYAHGGISLHECLIPVLTIEKIEHSIIEAKISTIKWVGLTCKVETIQTPDGYKVDLRLNYNVEESSIVISNKEKKVINNKISIMVDGDADQKSAVVVLTDENGRILDKKPTLVGS